MPSPHLFTLVNVYKERPDQYGQRHPVLQGLTVNFRARGISCLVGASGSGKSTLLRLLNRLEDPDRGAVLLLGQDVRTLNPLDLRRRVGLVVQTPVMLPGTVRDNLEAGLRIRNVSLDDPASWLERVGLPPEMLGRAAKDLSGGEKQRVALARTLATRPEALLLDEATGSLDPDAAAAIESLVVRLGLPAVWVSHDMAQVERVATHVYRLESGVVREVEHR